MYFHLRISILRMYVSVLCQLNMDNELTKKLILNNLLSSFGVLLLYLLNQNNIFQQKHACLKLETKQQEQFLCTCFYLFNAEFE